MLQGIDWARWLPPVAFWAVVALAAVFALALFAGLFRARSLIRREFTSYFHSPIAYVVLVVFLAVAGHLFYLTTTLLTDPGPRGVEWPMRHVLGDDRFWLVFLFIPPLLTMRLFAEERGSGTLEVLMTAPLRDWQVVLSKYLACLAFYVVLWLPTLAYLPVLLDLRDPKFADVSSWQAVQNLLTPWTITFVVGLAALVLAGLLLLPRLGTWSRVAALVLVVLGGTAVGVGAWGHYYGFGRLEANLGVTRLGVGPFAADERWLVYAPAHIDPMPVLTSYLGLFLVGGMFLSLGLLVSSLVRSQMVAALVSLVLSLVFVVAGFWRPEMDTSGPVYRALYFFSVPLHFHQDFTRGLIDTRHLVLYGSVAVFCLFLTVRSLESRRWQ